MDEEKKILQDLVVEEPVVITQEDGVVPMKEVAPLSGLNENINGKMFHGKAARVSMATRDPRITRTFVKTACLIFLLIGIGQIGGFLFKLMLFHLFDVIALFFGLMFSVIAIIVYQKANKDIDKIANKMKEDECDVEEDPESVKQAWTELIGVAGDRLKGCINSVLNDQEDYNKKD